MTPEGKVKEAVKKLLLSKDCYYFFPMQNGLGRTGIPDIIACIPTIVTPDMVGKTIGQFLAVETKAPGRLRGVTPNQERELKAIASKGGIAVLADDVRIVEDALSKPPALGEFYDVR